MHADAPHANARCAPYAGRTAVLEPICQLEVEFEGEQAAVDFGSMDVGDDPLLAIVSEHVLGILEVARLAGLAPVHFDSLVGELVPLGIRVDDLDEAIAWLLQSEAIIEIDEDAFALSE